MQLFMKEGPDRLGLRTTNIVLIVKVHNVHVHVHPMEAYWILRSQSHTSILSLSCSTSKDSF